MNTFLSRSDTIIVKDSFGNNVEIPVPKTPEPMQIIEFEREDFHWRKIFTISIASIIIGFSIFGFLCFIVF